jgi:hypothetical protein
VTPEDDTASITLNANHHTNVGTYAEFVPIPGESSPYELGQSVAFDFEIHNHGAGTPYNIMTTLVHAVRSSALDSQGMAPGLS